MTLKLDNSIPKDPYTKQLWGESKGCPTLTILQCYLTLLKKTARLVKWGIPNSLIDQLLCITPKKSIAAQSFPRWQATVVLKRSSDFLEAILSMYFSFSDFFFLDGAIFHFLISNLLWPILLMIFWFECD